MKKFSFMIPLISLYWQIEYSEKVFLTTDGDIDLHKTNLVSGNYIYLSKMHPKKTAKEFNINDMKPGIHKDFETLWENYLSGKNTPATSFIKLSNNSL